MSEFIPLLASNALGVATGYLIARFSRPTQAPTLPNIEPPLAAPLVMYPKCMTPWQAAQWLREMADKLEASHRQQKGDNDARQYPND